MTHAGNVNSTFLLVRQTNTSDLFSGFFSDSIFGNEVVKPKPKMPPHIVAIKALEELKNRKLCENGKHKAYYTSLVSILKVYIDGRWDISVLDKTSAETMVALRDVELSRECRSNLIAIFETADFVKFAKVVPETQTNEEFFLKAYYFVENTKAIESIVNDKKNIIFETTIDE